MDSFCAIVSIIWLVAIVWGVIKKTLGIDDESKARKVEQAEEEVLLELIGKAYGAIALMGNHAGSSDGSVSDAERSVVKEWLEEKIGDIKSEYQARVRRHAYATYNSSSGRLSSDQLAEHAEHIKEGPGENAQEALLLCFKVVASDGVLSPGEYQTLQAIQKSLDISDSRFRDLYDLHLSQLRRTDGGGGGPRVDELGIDPSWTKERKLAHLMEEFAKYNARMQAVRDDAQRAHCKRMIDLITRTKSELEGTAKPKKTNPDELLLGIDSDLSVPEKRQILEREESRWIARRSATQSTSGLQKCVDALEAISRLRSLYANAS
jgi:uncharacterized tellurite resistance protein B-like protein